MRPEQFLTVPERRGLALPLRATRGSTGDRNRYEPSPGRNGAAGGAGPGPAGVGGGCAVCPARPVLREGAGCEPTQEGWAGSGRGLRLKGAPG